MANTPDDPLFHFTTCLDRVLGRSTTWITSVEALRNNISTLVEVEKLSAAQLRKTASSKIKLVDLELRQRVDTENDSVGPAVNSLAAVSTQCFGKWLKQKIAQHESLAGILSKLDGKEGVALSKLAKQNAAFVEARVVALCDALEKARNELRVASTALSSASSAKDAAARDTWLLKVQEAAARRGEREACSRYCKEARELLGEAEKLEKVVIDKSQAFLAAAIEGQSAAASALHLLLEAHGRAAKAMDPSTNWREFMAQSDVSPVARGSAEADWRRWSGSLTALALEQEARGDAMSAGTMEEMLANGYLLRQGTVLGFTWKKHYWVLTANGSLHEFPSRSEPCPVASYFLPHYFVELVLSEDGLIHLSLHPRERGWFSTGAPTKLILKAEGGAAIHEWVVAIQRFVAERPP